LIDIIIIYNYQHKRSHDAVSSTQQYIFLDSTDALTFELRKADIASTVQQSKLMLSLQICYWHAANTMNVLIMKLHKANIVPA
jgi:hypothetical protein